MSLVRVGRSGFMLVCVLVLTGGLGAQSAGAIDIACPSASQCTAVNSGSGGMTQTPSREVTFAPDSGAANAAGVALIGGPQPTAVSCPSSTQCTSVGPNPAVNGSLPGGSSEVTFNPTSGVVNGAGVRSIEATGDLSHAVQSVSCPSISQCTGVDGAGRQVTFDPTTGALNAAGITTIDSVDVNAGPRSVSCISSTQCTAVAGSNEATFDPTSGTVNAVGTKAVVAGYLNLSSVACPSSTQCTAVAAGPSNSQEVTFDPTSGTVNSAGAKAIIASSALRVEVSCPLSLQCTAVDADGLEVTFDPTSGTVNAAGVKKVDPQPLALSCPSSTECTILNQGFQDLQALTFDPTTGTANAAGNQPIFGAYPSGGGRPPPPPAPAPAPAPAQPSAKQVVAALVKALTPSGAAAKIGAILKAGAYSAALSAPSAGTARIAWYEVPRGAHIAAQAPVLVASGSRTLSKAGKTTLRIKLTSKGKALLKKLRGHELKLTAKGSFTPKGGKTTTRLKAFTLRR